MRWPCTSTSWRAWRTSRLEAFVQEVRRFYPFFPAAMAAVQREFEWSGMHFRRGDRVLLDLYGTNRDPACWDDPERFLPSRFIDASPLPYAFIPQGGGDAAQHHRCPGEDFTVGLMVLAMRKLTQKTRYDLVPQDWGLDMRRLPALPLGGLQVRNLHAIE